MTKTDSPLTPEPGPASTVDRFILIKIKPRAEAKFLNRLFFKLKTKTSRLF